MMARKLLLGHNRLRYVGCSRRIFSSSSGQGALSRFAADWNETIDRRPQEVLVSFLSASCTTWLVTYHSLLALGLQLPPELAAGWFFARMTRKFRQPINLGLAAATTKVFPVLSTFHVSPIVTGFTSKDTQEWSKTREKIESDVPSAKPVIDKLQSGAQWLQGPVDRYGLSFFLSGKVTFLITMSSASFAIQHGIDLESILTSLGISTAAQGVVGTVAASSVGNIAFVPLHFYGTVRGVQAMEVIARKYKELRDAEEKEDASKDNHRQSGEEESDAEEKALNAMKWALLLWTMTVTLYQVRLMAKKATDKEGGEGKPEEEELSHKPDPSLAQ